MEKETYNQGETERAEVVVRPPLERRELSGD
jgi:hypothetical protein